MKPHIGLYVEPAITQNNKNIILRDNMELELNLFEFPLNPNYSRFLFYSSFMIGLSSMIAFYINDRILTLFLFLLFLTSINYWRKPEYGLRRQIDMSLCAIGFLYFIISSFVFLPEFNRIMYINTFICIGVFYTLEYILSYLRSAKWIVFHMVMHIYTAFFSVIVFLVFVEDQFKNKIGRHDEIILWMDTLFDLL